MDSRVRMIRYATLVYGLVALIALGPILGCGSEGSDLGQRLPGPDSTRSNRVPVVHEIRLSPANPMPGREVRATARVVDPDGDPTTVVFRWQTRRGRMLGEGRALDTSGLEPGSRLEVVAIASDGREESAAVTRGFKLSSPSAEIAFVAIDEPEGSNKPGSVLKSIVELVDDDSGRAEVELQWKVNGKVVGTAEEIETSSFAPGDVVILRARVIQDGHASRFSSSAAIELSRGAAPEILSKPLAGIVGGVFRYPLLARGREPGAELSYSLMSGPDGMVVDEKSGLVSWRPTHEQRGRFAVEVGATDQWGTGTAQSFVIVVEAPGASPASLR